MIFPDHWMRTGIISLKDQRKSDTSKNRHLMLNMILVEAGRKMTVAYQGTEKRYIWAFNLKINVSAEQLKELRNCICSFKPWQRAQV